MFINNADSYFQFLSVCDLSLTVGKVWSIWASPFTPAPPRDRAVLGTQWAPVNISYFYIWICFICFYLISSPSVPGKIFMANFCLSGWHWSSCTCSFKRVICPFIWCTRKRTADLFQFHLFMKSNSTNCWLINSTDIYWVLPGARPWDREAKRRQGPSSRGASSASVAHGPGVSLVFLFRYFPSSLCLISDLEPLSCEKGCH